MGCRSAYGPSGWCRCTYAIFHETVRACAENSVGGSQPTIRSERLVWFAIIVEPFTSVRSKQSTFIITAPYHPLASPRISIQQYTRRGLCQGLQFLLENLFQLCILGSPLERTQRQS